MINKDFYLILGVPRTESPSGIRAAFRKLAKRYHPEHIGPQGARFFDEILTAYRVLSHPEKRHHYTQGLFHAEGKEAEQPEPIIVGPAPQSLSLVPQPLSILKGVQTVYPSPEELFAQVRSNFTRAEGPDEESVRNLTLQVILSPEEAAKGGIACVGVPVFYPCPVCGGSGRDWLFSCTSCQERGMVAEEESVRVYIPPLVRDDTRIEVPVRGLGIHNLCLHLCIRVVA